MGISRRQFLGMLSASPFLLSGISWASSGVYASAGKDAQGNYILSLFDMQGQEHLTHRLPSRAHQVLAHPKKPWLFAVARRPGTFIDWVDLESKTLHQRIQCKAGYHMYGHAQVTADGQYLMTSEHSPQDDLGRIVIRDLNNQCRIVDEYNTAGIGPHQFLLSADQKRLIIANGGIKTLGRKKINLDTMQPSLVYLDAQSGELLEQAYLEPEFNQCSIRHIDTNSAGQVAIAMQYQGHLADNVPLIACHEMGSDIKVLNFPDRIRQQLKQYCGSACCDTSGQFAAFSAPKGNRVLFFDLSQQQFTGEIRARDGCGLARGSEAGYFIVSTGRGRIYQTHATELKKQTLFSAPFSWDNHLTLT